MRDTAVNIRWLRLDGLTSRQWTFCESLLDDDERAFTSKPTATASWRDALCCV
jgi:hypothetical protein